MAPGKKVACWIAAAALACVSVADRHARAQQTQSPQVFAVPLAVFDKQWQPITGLTTAQIQAKDLQAGVRLTPADGPGRIVILLDVSASMVRPDPEGTGAWDRARHFIRAFASLNGGSEKLALHAYAERHEVLVPFTKSRGIILAALDSLPSPGSEECENRFGYETAFLDTLLSLANSELDFGDAILLVGDDIADTSKAEMEPTLRAMVDRGVRVFWVNLAYPDPRGARPELGFYRARETVAATGGSTLYFWEPRLVEPVTGPSSATAETILSMARAARSRMEHFYRLELNVGIPLKKKRKLKISVLDADKKRSNVRLLHPKFLYLASSNTAKGR